MICRLLGQGFLWLDMHMSWICYGRDKQNRISRKHWLIGRVGSISAVKERQCSVFKLRSLSGCPHEHTLIRKVVKPRLIINFEDGHLSPWQKFKRFRDNKVTHCKKLDEKKSSEPKTKKIKMHQKRESIRRFRGFAVVSLPTIDTNPVSEPEPMLEPQAFPSSRPWSTRRILPSDMEYHSTLVSAYYKKSHFKEFEAILLTCKKEIVWVSYYIHP